MVVEGAICERSNLMRFLHGRAFPDTTLMSKAIKQNEKGKT